MSRFQREAQLLASLNHASMVAIYGVEECGGKRALVLELLEGVDLSEKLNTGTPPVDEVVDMCVISAEFLAEWTSGLRSRVSHVSSIDLSVPG